MLTKKLASTAVLALTAAVTLGASAMAETVIRVQSVPECVSGLPVRIGSNALGY